MAWDQTTVEGWDLDLSKIKHATGSASKVNRMSFSHCHCSPEQWWRELLSGELENLTHFANLSVTQLSTRNFRQFCILCRCLWKRSTLHRRSGLIGQCKKTETDKVVSEESGGQAGWPGATLAQWISAMRCCEVINVDVLRTECWPCLPHHSPSYSCLLTSYC